MSATNFRRCFSLAAGLGLVLGASGPARAALTFSPTLSTSNTAINVAIDDRTDLITATINGNLISGNFGTGIQVSGGSRDSRVARHSIASGMRPARIAAVVGDEDEQQVERQRTEEKPLRFAYQAREACGQRRGAAPVRCGQDYSGSMMVSRSTMLEPRISI